MVPSEMTQDLQALRRAVPPPVQDLLFCIVTIGAANHAVGPFTLGAQLIGAIVLAAALQCARSLQMAQAAAKPTHHA